MLNEHLLDGAIKHSQHRATKTAEWFPLTIKLGLIPTHPDNFENAKFLFCCHNVLLLHGNMDNSTGINYGEGLKFLLRRNKLEGLIDGGQCSIDGMETKTIENYCTYTLIFITTIT